MPPRDIYSFVGKVKVPSIFTFLVTEHTQNQTMFRQVEQGIVHVDKDPVNIAQKVALQPASVNSI